jgi:predicted glutamine amidotransferase
MCGIVGYIGFREAYPIVIKGLKRLEYRGYDSAGIMLYADKVIKIAKTKGKVSDLEEKSKDMVSSKATIGMGHTRWATHGVPNDINSHPHVSNSGNLVIIHNGIIENYATLKEGLLQRGHKFSSDTDTEVLAHLIEDVMQNAKLSLADAVRASLKQVVGAYAIVILSKNHPEHVIAARKGSPLVVGLGKERGYGPHLHLSARIGGKHVNGAGNFDYEAFLAGQGGNTAAPAAPAAPAASGGRKTVKRGSKGADVVYLQQKLGIGADGDFGPKTHAAVTAFQSSKGLVADGIVGPKTWAAIG